MPEKSGIGTLQRTSTNPFSLEWDIDDYFNRSQKADRYLESPFFTFGGAIWHLQLFPNGLQTSGCVELFLLKKQSFEEVHDVSCTIGIKDNNGSIFLCAKFSRNIKGCCPVYGIQIIERSALENLQPCLVPTNILKIFVEDLVLNNKQNTDLDCKPQILQMNKTVSAGAKVLSENLKALLLNEEGCDVTFKVENVEIQAHRPVLIARSPIFASMFKHEMSETITGIVEILDCTPDAFRVLLLYLYSGTVENLSTDVIYDLYQAAVKYDLEYLKTECVQFLKDNISLDTLYDTLALSKKHEESELLEHATNYFNEHVLDILLTMKWQLFLKGDPVTANELYVKAIQKKCLNSFIPKAIECQSFNLIKQ